MDNIDVYEKVNLPLSKPVLSEKLSYLAISQYAKQYVQWKSDKIACVHADSDDIAIVGEELKDMEKIQEYINDTYGKFFSIISIVNVLYTLAKFSPDTEGRAKNVFLCSTK